LSLQGLAAARLALLRQPHQKARVHQRHAGAASGVALTKAANGAVRHGAEFSFHEIFRKK
jgi:hypothetical protein